MHLTGVAKYGNVQTYGYHTQDACTYVLDNGAT